MVPTEHGDIPASYVSLPEAIPRAPCSHLHCTCSQAVRLLKAATYAAAVDPETGSGSCDLR